MQAMAGKAECCKKARLRIGMRLRLGGQVVRLHGELRLCLRMALRARFQLLRMRHHLPSLQNFQPGIGVLAFKETLRYMGTLNSMDSIIQGPPA